MNFDEKAKEITDYMDASGELCAGFAVDHISQALKEAFEAGRTEMLEHVKTLLKGTP